MVADEGDSLWARWRGQIEVVSKEVQDLVFYDMVFRLSMQALSKLPESRKNFVYGWVVATYARDAAIRIRRMLDNPRRKDSDTLSLISLLKEIGQRPEVVNVGRFAAEYPVGLRDTAPREFRAIVGHDGHSLLADDVSRDLEALDRVWGDSGLRNLTNWKIAHHTSKDPPVLPKWADVHRCIEDLEKVVLRYCYLLLQVDGRTLLPSNLDDAEEAVVTFWLGPGAVPADTLLQELHALGARDDLSAR